jgi:hypothetical protein
MNKTEWQIVHYYISCVAIAERNGLCIKQEEDDFVKIIALKEPYSNESCLARITGFYAAMKWLEGYEQKDVEIKHTKE